MPVRRNIDDLPVAEKPNRPPSRNNIVVNEIANAWYDRYLANSEYLPAIPGRTFRASSISQRCDRALYYSMTRTPETNPPTIADSWRMALGQMIHDSMDDVLANIGGGWRPEVIVDLEPIGIDGSAHADMVQFTCVHCAAPITMIEIVDTKSDGWQEIMCQCANECDAGSQFTIERKASGAYTWAPEHERAVMVCELKSVSGWPFKTKATNQGGPPEGPQYAHIMQGAVAADALGCDRLIVAYLSLEPVSPSLAKAYCNEELGRFAAEWHYSITQMRPVLDREYARINRLLRATEAKVLPARELYDQDIPVGAFIVNPQTGAWATTGPDGHLAQTGSTWFCNYCRHRAQCVSDGAAAGGEDVEL